MGVPVDNGDVGANDTSGGRCNTPRSQIEAAVVVCAWCRRIQDLDGVWCKVDSEALEYLEARLSHGICPECLRNLT